MKQLSILFLFIALLATACDDDDAPAVTNTFEVAIENVFAGNAYFQSGSIEAVPPGNSLSFSFHAGAGHRLSFATMFVQSNDLFYAPAETGIELYDQSGNPVTGDVTAQVDLWDAGTEVNQAPGVGPDQAPRQSGPDTGADEGGTVGLVNDGFSYPADESVLRVTLNHDAGTEFTLTLTNISDGSSLPTPLAPGVWAVHGEGSRLFTVGEAASAGLEALAEDGMNATMAENLEAGTGLVSPFAPGAWAISREGNPLFTLSSAASAGLEALAEDGDPSILATELQGASGVIRSGIFNTPAGAGSPGPLFPGQEYTFTFEAEEGDVLSFATMLVQSNDLFVAPDENGIPLYSNGQALSGEITLLLQFWDAGTEVNQFPGAGADQAPRQSGPDTGAAESGTVELVNDGYSYPPVENMVRVTVNPNQ